MPFKKKGMCLGKTLFPNLCPSYDNEVKYLTCLFAQPYEHRALTSGDSRLPSGSVVHHVIKFVAYPQFTIQETFSLQ